MKEIWRQSSDYVIQATGLTKEFPEKNKSKTLALNSINMNVAAGRLTAIIGPDGAGKTTLMRLICGLLTKTEGTLNVLGLDVTSQPQEVQAQLSYMPGKFGLYEDLTVQENMNLYADLHGVPEETRAKRFSHLLEMTGLTQFTNRLAGKLSGGMKQKLGLACTLVRSPKLLLLDEPTVGVDPLSRRELWEILKHLVAEEKLSVFVSTAYMDEAAMCEDVYIINKGCFLAQGSPDEICAIAKGRSFTVKAPVSASLRLLQSELLSQPEITDAVPYSGVIRFTVADGVSEVPYLNALGLKAVPVEPRLEDSFMILLQKDKNKAELTQSEALSVETSTKKSMEKAGTLEDLYRYGKEAPVEIEVRNLVKKFGDFTAVGNTSFEVHRGEVFGLLGPNGAGKTTTFRMLCGLMPATSGHLSVAGLNLREARRQARANVGYVSQKFSLYGLLSVYENLRFFGGAYGLSGEKLKNRMEAVIAEFDLADKLDYAADNLSGGYKQRLSMAAALMHEPKILFLDEPTSGIDPLARRSFWQRITELAAKGTTIIITTHFMDEAEYCDRFMIQDKGELLILGSPNEIRSQMHLPEADMNEIFIKIVEQARMKEGEAI